MEEILQLPDSKNFMAFPQEELSWFVLTVM
jgi:hypothetical protein